MDPFSLIGGLLGAFGSGDKQQSTSQKTEPWGPAQPWIQQNIQNGQDLQKYYQQNPFSQQQLNAYGNASALNNNFMGSLPSLFGQMSGQRQFDRANPLGRVNQFNFQMPQQQQQQPQIGSLGFSNPWDAILKARASAVAPQAPVYAPQQWGGDAQGSNSFGGFGEGFGASPGDSSPGDSA